MLIEIVIQILGGQLSGSFQVSMDVIQIPGGDLELSGSFQVSMDVIQIPGGQLSGSFHKCGD